MAAILSRPQCVERGRGRCFDHFRLMLLPTDMFLLAYNCLNNPNALQWRHNERDGVSNHQPHDCLLNCLFRRRSKRTSKLRVTGLCVENSPVTGEFPAQMASNAENTSFDNIIIVFICLSETGLGNWGVWQNGYLLVWIGQGEFWSSHDDVIEWKHFLRYWSFVRGIHWSPVNSPHKGQWRRALMFSLICAWIKSWVNNREAGDLRRHRAHHDVIVLFQIERWCVNVFSVDAAQFVDIHPTHGIENKTA